MPTYGTIGIAFVQAACASNQHWRTNINEYFIDDLMTAQVYLIGASLIKTIQELYCNFSGDSS